MRPYRVAIIGTGAIVDDHMRALRTAGERVEVVAAVDIDERRVRAFCERYNIPVWHTSARQMLTAIKPDLVHIATPPDTHFDLMVQSLEAGAWVFCEKPLCASLTQFDQIAQAEARTGRYVSTVLQWRFGSAVKHLRRLINTGALGIPLISLCQTLWYRDQSYYQVPWRGRWETEIGGATVGLGIHLMDLLLWLMGNWKEVYAIADTFDRPIEVDNVSMAIVRFENGALGTIINSAVSPRQESYLRLDFQRATVELNALYVYKNQNWRYSIPDDSSDAEALERWQMIEEDVAGTHDAQLLELLDSMDKNERPFVSGSEARRIIEFLASLYKSAFTRKAVVRGSITSNDPFYYSMNGAQAGDHVK